MKKMMVLAAVLFTSFSAVFAQDPDAVKGVWLNDGKDAKVEIYKSSDKYFGKIIWTVNMYEADGKTLRKDSKNTNEQLRTRTIQNMVILTGCTYSDGEWSGGEIYDPKSGKTYKSKLKIKGNSLEVRGYVGSPMFGKTTVWTRIS
jgi:uncharacterized protein (DUF2147 family)